MRKILDKFTKRFTNKGKDEGEWTEFRYADLRDVELDNANLDGVNCFRHAQFNKKEVEEY